MTDNIDEKVKNMIIPNFDGIMGEAHEAGKELDYICHVENILVHGNRIQKILVVCDLSFILRIIWITEGVKGFLSVNNYKFLWALIRYDYWDKAKLIWQRKVLA
jgi:hypothetical protein